MSNLLEKASIITTPTAYSDGKLHSVKPVQTLGDELIVNGDFENGSTGWTSYGTVDISNGIATIGASSNSGIFQGVLTQNRLYKVTLDVLSYNSVGNIQIINDTGFVLYSITQTGTHTFYFKHSISNVNIIFRGVSNALFSIDNVSVKEVIDADFDFQRGSAATRVNSQGLIENVQILSGNLVQNGDFSEIGSELVTNGGFDNGGANWVNINNPVFKNSTVIFEDNAKIYQNVVSDLSKFYKISIDLNSVANDGLQILAGSGNSFVSYSVNDIINNGNKIVFYSKFINNGILFVYSKTANTSAVINNVSVKEVGQNWSFGAGWSIEDGEVTKSGTDLSYLTQSSLTSVVGKTYRVKASITNVTTGNVRIDNFTSGTTYTSDTEVDVTFTATTAGVFRFLGWNGFDGSITNISAIEITDDTDLPRIDYTDGCGSLLLEPQSTNLITYSEDFSDSSWTLFGTIQANSSVSPNGLTTTTKLTHTHSQYNMLRVIAFGVRTTSVFVKNLNADNFYIRGSDSGYAYYNFNTKTVNNNSLKVEYFANDWIRLSLTESNSLRQFGIGVDESDLSESGNSVYVWGAQLEEQSYATSYIPTNGSTATRLADVCNNAGSSDLINSTEGVLYAEISALASTASQSSYLSISDGTYNNRASILFSNGSTNQIRTFLRVGGATQIDVSGNVADVTSFNKVAFSYKENDFKVYINGVLVSSDTNGSVWTADTITKLSFSEINTNAGTFKGNVKALVVFKEALTNDELEGLTGEGYDTFNALALANNYTII
jgi:hypothetical protein